MCHFCNWFNKKTEKPHKQYWQTGYKIPASNKKSKFCDIFITFCLQYSINDLTLQQQSQDNVKYE